VSGENLARIPRLFSVRLALGQILLLLLPSAFISFSLCFLSTRCVSQRREETPGFLGKALCGVFARVRTRNHTRRRVWSTVTRWRRGREVASKRKGSSPGIPTVVVLAPGEAFSLRSFCEQLDVREDGITSRENRPENVSATTTVVHRGNIRKAERISMVLNDILSRDRKK